MAEHLAGPVDVSDGPLITVAMPVYNAGEFLRLAVLSIVEQTYANWELLLIDDGSTDSALVSISDITDARIVIFRDGANKGLAARLNEAIDLAKGDYFCRMDQDDVSYPQRFEQQLQRLQSDPDLDLVAVQAVTISGTNKILGMLPWDDRQEEISAKPWRGFYLPHPTWMGKLSWFRKHRYAFPGPYFCEDQELLLRAYDKSHFDLIREPLFAYRLRDGFDIGKLVKTRASVLVVQLHHFIKKGQWRFAALSALTFFGRLAVDLFRTRLGRFLLTNPDECSEIFRRWELVLLILRTSDCRFSIGRRQLSSQDLAG